MKRTVLVVLALVCLSSLLIGSAEAVESIKVGIILPLTGDKAKFGEIEKNSFQMALEEINAQGSLGGRQLELVFGDDTGVPEVARSVAQQLITTERVVMLGGGYGSAETFAIAKVAQQSRVPFLVNTGSDNNITEQNWDYVFRLNPPVSDYSKGLESFLGEVVKPKTAVIIYENSSFGSAGSKQFEASCGRLGIRVLFSEGYQSGAKEFKPVLLKIKQSRPDLLYMISYLKDAILLMRQSKELEVMPRLFVGGAAGFSLPEFQKEAGKAADMVYSATLWYQTLPYPGAMEYYEKYAKKFGADTEYHGAEAYAAAQVIADVFRRSMSLSSSAIRQVLDATDMMTVFGPVRFADYDTMTNQNRLPTYLVQWINGKLELVWPQEIASHPYVFPIDWAKVWQ
jgi:branched-chain amino acid transport system substrate-binding protein